MQKIPAYKPKKALALLLAAASVMPMAIQAGEGLSGAAAREYARRQQAVTDADQLLHEGRVAYAKGDYQTAVDNYRKALGVLPNGSALDDRRTAIKQNLADGSVALAGKYRSTGKYTEAREALEYVLSKDVDPNNALAKRELDFLDDPIRTNPALTYEHTQNVDAVRRRLYMGEGYYDLGKYDEANREFEAVLRIDPYNTAARRFMERISQTKTRYYNTAYDQARAKMLEEVSAAWELAVPGEAPIVTNPDGIIDANLDGSARISDKLKTIQVSVNFEDVTVEEAVDYLRLRAKELDSTGEGVNFVIRKPKVGAAPAAAPEGGAGIEGAGAIGGLTTPEPGALRISLLQLNNVPLATALKYICDATKLKYSIDDHAVTIKPISDEADDIVTRSWDVPPDFLSAISDGAEGDDGGAAEDPFGGAPAAGGGAGIAKRKSVTELLKLKGVQFNEGTSADFNPRSGKLTVRNTPTQMDTIDAIIDGVKGSTPKQVQILTKFVEISQENTEELGFDWIVTPFGIGNGLYPGGGTIGSGAPRGNTDFITEVSETATTIPGIPAQPNTNVSNIMTGANRSGNYAITRDSIDSILNNPNRTGQSNSVAPGIMSLTGLFTDGQVQMIMRGLSQKKGADVMTAPNIVARSGDTATIEIIREFIYPTEYEPPELPNSVGATGGIGGGGLGGGTAGIFPVTPATPTAFEPRNTGVTLTIQPTFTDPNAPIDLQFSPEIVEFEGFINYGSPIQSPSSDALGNPTTVTITENRIEMPVFSVRRVKTNLHIFDGHTVAVGGLMREDVQNVEDKVPIFGDLPLIGRLFQTKAENRIKSNLIVFVTAKMIDATGRPLKDAMPANPAGAGVDAIDGGVLPPLESN